MRDFDELIESSPVQGIPFIDGVVPLSMLKSGIQGVYAIVYEHDFLYVGESYDLKSRFINHLSCGYNFDEKKNQPLYRYLNSLILRGETIGLEILESNFEKFDMEKWQMRLLEGKWIHRFKDEGYDLFNRSIPKKQILKPFH